MKKSSLILAAFLAASALCACGGKEDEKTKKYKINPTITGGSDGEKQALLDAINKGIAHKNGKDTIQPGTDKPMPFAEDTGDYIRLTTKIKQKNKTDGKTYNVSLDWKVDETQDYFKEMITADDTHDIIYIAYKGYEHKKDEGTITWTLDKVTCGGAVAKNVDAKFKGSVENAKHNLEDITIAQIQAVDNQEKTVKVSEKESHYYPSTFKVVDYELHEGEKTYSPYFFSNQDSSVPDEEQYYYVNVQGKVIYAAPDGNWALLADGKNVIELYAGSGTALNVSNFPYLFEDVVKVSGNLSHGFANMQVGFITNIAKGDSKTVVAPDLSYPTMTKTEIANLTITGHGDDMSQKQAVEGLPNSLKTITGTVVADSFYFAPSNSLPTKVDDSKVSSVQNNRFYFDIDVGDGTLMRVAYDYHTDASGSVGLFNALKAAYKPGQSITVKGTMRYNGNKQNPFVLENHVNADGQVVPGVWSICPFEANHIA